eukprot:gb/GECH01008272.1/.p1 GENE.gb/GECH01008272.1/~~gb/GECH01008272.1/.p1  ORF type:complete len:252 (+),score=23.08 gb/GECH01008272.1/:1-756(+)
MRSTPLKSNMIQQLCSGSSNSKLEFHVDVYQYSSDSEREEKHIRSLQTQKSKVNLNDLEPNTSYRITVKAELSLPQLKHNITASSSTVFKTSSRPSSLLFSIIWPYIATLVCYSVAFVFTLAFMWFVRFYTQKHHDILSEHHIGQKGLYLSDLGVSGLVYNIGWIIYTSLFIRLMKISFDSERIDDSHQMKAFEISLSTIFCLIVPSSLALFLFTSNINMTITGSNSRKIANRYLKGFMVALSRGPIRVEF